MTLTMIELLNFYQIRAIIYRAIIEKIKFRPRLRTWYNNKSQGYYSQTYLFSSLKYLLA